MRKKIISIMLITLMLLAFFPSTAFAATSGTCGTNAKWKVVGNTLTIYGKGSTYDYAKTLPPWYFIEGIEKIVVSEGITGLGDFTFYERFEAKTISLPKSLKTLGEDVFNVCYGTEKYIVAKGSKYFYTDETGSLYQYGEDGDSLYAASAKIDGKFVIKENVKKIYSWAFHDSWYITGFEVEEGNKYFASDEQGALYNKEMNYLILLPQGYVGKFVIPEGVGVIDEYACWYCSFLTEVVIPEGVLSIGEGAFEGCWELTTVYLPQSLMGINKNAFKDSDKITDVYYNGSITQWEKNVHKYYEGNFHLWNDGVIHYTCTHLNTQKTEDIKCLEPEKWTCSDCGEVYTVGNSLGHQSEFIPETSPTCTDPGTSGFGSRCSLCGFIIFEPQIIPALGHKGEWIITKEATKTEAGTKERTCTVCGEKEVVSYNLYKTGDVNGDEKINALDATQILRYANNKSSVLTSMDESEMYGRADVTGDGKINALDATQILRYANNKSSVLTK